MNNIFILMLLACLIPPKKLVPMGFITGVSGTSYQVDLKNKSLINEILYADAIKTLTLYTETLVTSLKEVPERTSSSDPSVITSALEPKDIQKGLCTYMHESACEATFLLEERLKKSTPEDGTCLARRYLITLLHVCASLLCKSFYHFPTEAFFFSGVPEYFEKAKEHIELMQHIIANKLPFPTYYTLKKRDPHIYNDLYKVLIEYCETLAILHKELQAAINVLASNLYQAIQKKDSALPALEAYYEISQGSLIYTACNMLVAALVCDHFPIFKKYFEAKL